MFISAGSARLTISTIITLTETGKLRPPYSRGSVKPMRSAWVRRSRLSTMPGAYTTSPSTSSAPARSTSSARGSTNSPAMSPTISSVRG